MWKNILKRFGPQQTPKPSLGSKVKQTTQPVSDAEPLPEDEDIKYKVALTERMRSSPSFRGRWIEFKDKYNTRQEAFDALEESMYENRNPDPWTVEGDLYGGHCIVYDGIFMVLGAPSYYYIIIEDDEELPDPLSYNPRVDNVTRDRVLDRFEGRKYDTSRF